MSNTTLPALPEFETPIADAIGAAFSGQTLSVKAGSWATDIVFPEQSVGYGDGYTVSDGTYYLKGVQLPYVDVIRDGEPQVAYGVRPFVSRRVDDDGNENITCSFSGQTLTPATSAKLGATVVETIKALNVDWEALAIETEKYDRYIELRRLHSEAERAIEAFNRRLERWES